ncbi:MAG: hypothetical protein PWR25_719 [Euryarchaeota archaeon]|jgi:plastocyanin|nr:hypothetical protein [Euryarchaeota archaeon]
MVSRMRPNIILLVALLVVSAGVLAAGCTLPSGNVTPPTAPPTGTETPSVTETTVAGTGTPAATATTAGTDVTTTTTTGVAGGGATTIDLTAENIAFDTSTITVPAGAEVTVNFNNMDDGTPHNFAVYTDSSAAEEIFVGDTITGPDTTTYTFTAPEEPGTYFFRCDVHPQQMTGDFIVQ